MPEVDRRTVPPARRRQRGAVRAHVVHRQGRVDPGVPATGSLRDVEHIVVLMQENRSFDHYFGTMRGVRGFGDPHPAMLRNGRSVWRQPSGAG